MPSPPASLAAVDAAEARACYLRREATRHEARETLRRRRLAETRDTVRRLAPAHAALRAVYLFGSLVKPGRFTDRSDIDMAVVCDDLETESRFWSAVDEELGGIVDLRPLAGGVAAAVEHDGECVYDREAPGPRT